MCTETHCNYHGMVRTKNQNQMLSTFLLVLSCVRNSFVLFAGFLFRWPLWISFILNRIGEIHSALLHTLIMNRTNEIVIISHSTSECRVSMSARFFLILFFPFSSSANPKCLLSNDAMQFAWNKEFDPNQQQQNAFTKFGCTSNGTIGAMNSHWAVSCFSLSSAFN